MSSSQNTRSGTNGQQQGRPVGAASEVYGNVSLMSNGQGIPGLANHPNANSHTESKFFSKRYISYISNNMDFKGFTKITTPGTSKFTYTNDEGFHFIPYYSPAAAFNEVKWMSGMLDAEAFRIRDMGFEITDITPMTTRATSIASSTEIESDFSPELVLMVMTDPERDTEINRINSTLGLEFDHNCDWSNPVVKTQGDGLLPRCQWGYTKTFIDTLTANTKIEDAKAFNTVSFFQDYPIYKFIKGQKISYTERGATNWYPLGEVNRPNPAYANKDTTKFKTVVQELLSSSIIGKFGITDPFTPLVGMLESKGATEMNDLPAYRPMPIYIKGYPYVGKDGPIDMTVQIEIKYHYTIDFKKRRVGAYPFHLLDDPPASWKTTERSKRVPKLGYTMATPRQVNYPLNMYSLSASGGGDYEFYTDNFVTHRQPNPESDSDYMVVESSNPPSPRKRRYLIEEEPSSSYKSPRR